MSKTLPIILLLALSLTLIGGGSGAVYADKSFYYFGDKPTFSYLPPTPHLAFKTSPNWSMDINAPDGSCNIKGKINNNDGSCTAPSIVLTDNDFTTFKNGIAILAVTKIQQTGMPAQDYCPVANWVWGTQDSVFQAKYPKNLVVPDSCSSVPSSLTVTTSSTSYSLGQIISISGKSPTQTIPITIMIISPINSIVTVAQIQSSGGMFSDDIQTGGVLWKTTGVYTVKVTQGTSSTSTQFTLTSAVPEFGPIASIILAIATLSIVMFIRKTGLRFV